MNHKVLGIRLGAIVAALLAVPVVVGAQSDDEQEGQGGEVREISPPRLNLRRQDVDLENGRVAYSISRVAVRATIEIRGMQRDLVHSQEIELDGVRAGARIEVTWPVPSEPVALIEVTTWDADGASVTFKIWPFRVEIPHVDVVFETNKWEIRDAEQEKLDEAWVKIEQAFRDYGDWIEAGLYIAGFTDTVGQPGDNQTLAEHRAQAIAEYFVAKAGDLEFPIHVRGYGEHCLAQETGDGVDCEANRRAAYVLAVDPPAMCASEGSGGWRRLR
ncbi:MAG: OmpA family protein [Deltaproteobacteria bacterium]|nr:OmpA family protein [Deltaproteobacteria bacterium]